MNYINLTKETRKTVLSMIYKAQVSHIGSNFSAIDILEVLYSKADFKKDKLVVSKGWIAATIYALGVKYQLCPQEAVDAFCDGKSKYIGLIEPLYFWGAEVAGGSMGLSFSMGVGMARARKSLGKDGIIYILMSDGEKHCGNIWESARKVVQEKLDNVIVIIDNNGLCAMGKTDEILKIKPENLFDGWTIKEINGHDYEQIESALSISDRPLAIVANTIKGYPISFMSDNNLYHYKKLDENEYNLALEELNGFS